MAKFDWWQGTIPKADPQVLLDTFAQMVGLADVAPDTPRNGYTRGAKVTRGPRTFGTVWWGGNPGVHVKLTGENAHAFGDWLREQGAQPSRVDVCEDWVEEGLADTLFAGAQRFAIDRGIMVQHQGDWTRGQARTLYLGSRQSSAQLVIYEKGHQLDADPAWVRLEVRLYPKRNREQVGQLTAGQCLGVVTWVREFLETLGWSHLQGVAIGTVYAPSDDARARAAFLRQYGKIMASWADEVGGWEYLGPTIAQEIHNSQARERQRIARDDYAISTDDTLSPATLPS